MPAKFFLKNLTVPAPCHADWDAMKGNDQVRFCEHCDLSVHNLSQMTPPQALRLVSQSNGRLCVRFEQDPRGRIVRTPVKQKLHHISRRASRIAAGAFTATLSLTSAVAQSCPTANGNVPRVSQPAARWGLGSSVVGSVIDASGAAITSAGIALINGTTNLALYTSSDSSGQFRIDSLEAGMYQLRIEAPGFTVQESDFYVQANNETRADRTLHVVPSQPAAEVPFDKLVYSSRSFGGAMVIVSPEHPFVLAAQEDDLERLTSLIAGTDVNLRDKRTGTTALEHAVRNANREMVQLLLAAGANANARDASGETVLMMVDSEATSELIWDLLNAGAKVNLKAEDDNTALMAAVSANNLDAVRTLLDAGAEINAQNDEGQTALMIAATEGYVNIVHALVVAGASLSLTDKEHQDALALAKDNGRKAVVRLLRSKGALETVAWSEVEEEP